MSPDLAFIGGVLIGIGIGAYFVILAVAAAVPHE